MISLPTRPGGSLSRRTLLLAVAAVTAGACAPSAPGPSPVPTSPPSVPTAKPTSKPAPTTAPAKPAATTAAKPAAQSGPAKLSPPQAIKIGIPALRSDHVYRYMGVEKGFYKELGVEPEFVQLRGDPLVLKSLLAQEIDLAEISIVGVLGAIEGGGALKILGSYLPRLDIVLYSKKDINKVEDLYGRSVGHSGDNGLPHAVILALFDKYKLDPTKVEFVKVGNSAERWRAMLAGHLDATATTIDRIPEIEAQPELNIKLLVNLPKELPDYVQSCVISYDKTIAEKTPLITNFLVAYGQSVRYCLQHRDEAVPLSAKLASLTTEQTGFSYDWYKENRKVDPNFQLGSDTVSWMQSFNTRIGIQQHEMPVDQVLDGKIGKQVLKYLGEYKP